jgi:hypothetical protein
LNELPSVPPTNETTYQGASTTGAIRASLQHSLDSWKVGYVTVPEFSSKEGTTGFETRSFGETHASELSTISSASTTSIPATGSLYPIPTAPAPVPVQPYDQHPIDPSALNNTPANIPSQDERSGKFISEPDTTSEAALSHSISSQSQSVPKISPTVAETGMPIAAGASGPGPKTGSLSRVSGAMNTGSASGSVPKYESAEEEKRRLEREERDRILTGAQPPPSAYHAPPSAASTQPAYESADEEKKRLERQERERVLRMGGSNVGNIDNTERPSPDGGSVPPPYQD